MFGMGMGEIILIAIVALLVVGPERLPGAAKAIGKGIRDLRSQTKDLQQTIEHDTEIGDAVREIRGALRGDPETLYKRATGEDFHDKPKEGSEKATAKSEVQSPSKPAAPEAPDAPDSPEAPDSVIDQEFANNDDGWGDDAVNPHDAGPVIETPENAIARGDSDSDNSDNNNNSDKDDKDSSV